MAVRTHRHYRPTRMSDIVLVHGAWHGPWCWTDVAAALGERGHCVEAVCLPGHDGPGTNDRIWNGISHHVDAVADAVSRATDPPMLVGHSMGGYVIQRFLETGTAAHAVLVASVPRRGTLGLLVRQVRRHPTVALKGTLLADFTDLIRSDALVRELFFTEATPDEIVTACRRQLQNESVLAVITTTVRPPRPAKVTTPVSVIGARHDGVFTLEEQYDLAEAYGVEPLILDGGHDLMLDTSWPGLVESIDAITRRR